MKISKGKDNGRRSGNYTGYCDEIGADGYSKDAQQAVEVAVPD